MRSRPGETEKFFIIELDESDEMISEESCDSTTCFGHTCDYWSGNSCDELESTYLCDCSGCQCAVQTCTNTASGATDSHDDGCSEYASEPSWCGGYDDSDFSSNDMCCVCDGGSTACTNTAFGATDLYNDGCSEYSDYPGWCGFYDDTDFSSGEMCCACGGGSAPDVSNVPLPSYDAASDDFQGTAMRGKPFPASFRKFSFCAAPGDYTLKAVDTEGDGWWSGARYWVVVDGDVVVNEQMGSRSFSIQLSHITVTLPHLARTKLDGNAALKGGGGACFWEDAPPNRIEEYRNDSRNVALYGNFTATPARTLSASSNVYGTVSGGTMSADAITVILTDRCCVNSFPTGN